MLTSPYSIYINKRPLRIAFLVEDKPESMVIIDTILAYNRDRWGGRYNPIVLTDGQTLTDTWWSLLEAVDPDIVKSFVTLSEELITSIERRVSPYLIEQPDRHEQESSYRRIDLTDDGIEILPTPLNVRRASWAMSEPILVLFGTDWQRTDPEIKRFTEWNFGGYSPPIHAVSRALEGVRTQCYAVTDAASLVPPLTELCEFRPFTYPIQLCSVPKEALPPVRPAGFDEAFHVVIGDAPADVAYFWNRPATIPPWMRTYLNQVWLSRAVATNPDLTSALSAWFQRCADPNGSHKGRVRFVSRSLSQDQLQQIAEPLARGVHRVFHDAKALPEIQVPTLSEWPAGPPGVDRMDLYRATGTTERLTLQEPDILRGPQGPHGNAWMADVYIEFRPERYPTVLNRSLWWQLPRLNGLATQMFWRSSRIPRTRYPSVLMKRDEPRLDLALPDDLAVFTSLATLSSRAQYTRDARHGRPPAAAGRRPFAHAEPSEKGGYLSGLLDLFGGLLHADDTFSTRYWRTMFDLLAGRPAEKEATLLEQVKNKLAKGLRANRPQFYENDKSMTWLANYVLNLARSLPASSRDLPFHIFDDHAQREMADFNARRAGHEPEVYSQADLVSALARLTGRGVLLMGVQARCSSCGSRAWHHIDDARQTLRCGGCAASFPMPPQQQWHYRLNSLARAAYADHGLLPVVLVLGQLCMDARSAFLFAPCVDLFEDYDKGPVGDLDIAVILDGRFVIGEVKQSRDGFDQATFVKMEGIARRLLPDVLLFASMDHEPTALISTHIDRLSTALKPLNIAVQWYALHEHKFEPDPVS